MAVTPVRLKAGSALTASVSVASWSASVAAGDILVLVVLANGTLTAGPAGWTTAAAAGSSNAAIFWKVATGSETSVSYTMTPTDRGSMYFLEKIPAGQLDAADPFDIANIQTAGGGTSYTTPTVSMSAGQKFAYAIIADAKDTAGGAASLSAWTNDYVETYDGWAQSTTPASAYTLSMGIATKEMTGGTSTSSGATYSAGTGSLARIGAIIVFNVAAESPPEDTTAPSVPTGLTHTAVTHNYVTLSWAASTDNVGVTGYDMRVDGGTPFPVTGTTRTVGSLLPATEYDFEVRAKDAAGNTSAWSAAHSVTTLATPVAGSWKPFGHQVLAAGHNGIQEVTTISGWTCDEDDLLLLVVMTDDDLLEDQAQPEDDGWTRLWEYVASNLATHVVWYKVADGTETDVTFSVRSFPDPPANVVHPGSVYQLVAVQGVDPADPIDTYNATTALGTAESGAITFSTPAITPSAGSKYALAALLDFKQTNEAPSEISGWGNGFTEISDVYGKPADVSTYMMNQAVAVKEIVGGSPVSTSANFLSSPLRLGASAFIVALNGLSDGAPGTSLPYVAGVKGRHFVDQFGDPILYRMDVSWRLPLRDTGTVWADYFTNRRAKGFTVVEVSIGPSLEGVPPNTDSGVVYGDGGGGLWDVSNAWLASLRTMADVAAEHGITLAIAVGYGWGFDTTERAAYVSKIATHFADAQNVTWVFGVDWEQQFWAGQSAEVVAVKDAMRAAGLTQPVTALLDPHFTTSDNPALVGQMDYESVYGYEAQYDLVAHAYSLNAGPVILGETNFEQENNEEGPNTTAETLRRQALWAMTRGAVGWDYGHQKIWRQDTGWQSYLDTPVHTQLTAIQRAFEAIDWWKLVPDTGNAFLTSGQGTKPTSGTQNLAHVDPLESTYATAARAADGSLAVVYMPTARAVTVNLGRLGANRSAYRVDPTNGAVTTLPVTTAQASPGTNAAGTTDWLYVFQADPIKSGPRVMVNGVELSGIWTVAIDGIEYPGVWSVAINGTEYPLA